MTALSLQVEGLGKQYRLGAKTEPYGSLRESLIRIARAPLRFAQRGADGGSDRQFWALRDVGFTVGHGEAIGIIGRNGAGKSTLLKLLSEITEPTEGTIRIWGRVASLLEVGTGFHPELSGRENIYLNGAILGMARREIARKFDEIVAFAEVEKFIDTQVKHYSSGMYLRLAFAVAAHLEPDILIVDEVLAVGDMSFQRKCLNKMESVGQQGRTVVFVSHNMPAITRLCHRVLLLEGGRLVDDGPAHNVAAKYLSAGLGTTAHRTWPDLSQAPGDEFVRLISVRVVNEHGETVSVADIRSKVGIEMHFEVLKPDRVLVPNLQCFTEEGVLAFAVQDLNPMWRGRTRAPGHYVSTAWIPGNFLSEGSLIVGAAVSTMDPVTVHFYERDAVAFQIVDSMDGDSARGDFAGTFPGVVRPLLEWTDGQCGAATADRGHAMCAASHAS